MLIKVVRPPTLLHFPSNGAARLKSPTLSYNNTPLKQDVRRAATLARAYTIIRVSGTAPVPLKRKMEITDFVSELEELWKFRILN